MSLIKTLIIKGFINNALFMVLVNETHISILQVAIMTFVLMNISPSLLCRSPQDENSNGCEISFQEAKQVS